MSDSPARVPLPKWPFYLADLALSAVVVYVFYRLGPIEGTTDIVIAVGCLFAAGWAAWISVTPWLTEHRTAAQLTDSTNLKSSLEQIQSLEKTAELIRQTNSQWQLVQDSAGRTVTAAREITDRMKAETEEFMKFLDNAHSSERAGLKLEVEKLRRMEGDWIKVTVQILDHVFAITRAAERSGQQQLVLQMQQFQTACREVARRIGLVPFTPNISEPFDSRAHQVPDPNFQVPAGSRIGDILASGFTYQGQLLRRALVMLEGEEPLPPKPAATAEQFVPPASPQPSEPEAEAPGASVPETLSNETSIENAEPAPDQSVTTSDTLPPEVAPAPASEPAPVSTEERPQTQARRSRRRDNQHELPLP